VRSDQISGYHPRSFCRSRELLVLAVTVAVGLGSVLSTPQVALAKQDGGDSRLDIGVDAAVTPTLQWSDCQDGFQCSTAQVPLDYHRPFGKKIDLA